MEIDEFLRRQRENTEKNRRHDELVSQYKAGTLTRPNIRWHQNIADIDLSLQLDKLSGKIPSKDLSVINDVNLDLLLGGMTKANKAFFRRKILYEYSSDRKTSGVLDCWYRGEKLIPPTILIFDQDYIDTLCPGCLPSTELQPVDGKHRLAICCYLNITHIPILVWNRQIDKINRILKKHPR